MVAERASVYWPRWERLSPNTRDVSLGGASAHLIDDILQRCLWFLTAGRRAEHPVHEY
jgi:hypothetical protein